MIGDNIADVAVPVVGAKRQEDVHVINHLQAMEDCRVLELQHNRLDVTSIHAVSSNIYIYIEDGH